ncbi:MAG: ThuA domain-containing protein [Verrucomicrobiia bacterium]
MKIKNGISALLFILISFFGSLCCADVLIVADEFPAMEAIATFIKSNANINCKIVSQSQFPNDCKTYDAIMVYIHRNLDEKVEKALIDYTLNGGKLIVLHHSISSGKRKNRYWFDFLGVSLPEGDVEKGGYKWIEGVQFEVVNLDSNHFITSNKIIYPDKILFNYNGDVKTLPSFDLDETEVYLNHKLTPDNKLLLGFKYVDKKSGKTYMQTHCGWTKKAGKGIIIYLMPGHSVKEFQNSYYSQIVLNAVLYKP